MSVSNAVSDGQDEQLCLEATLVATTMGKYYRTGLTMAMVL
jgi:hypothetical protein